jgi:hypothetical protein
VTDPRLCIGYPVRTFDLGRLAPAVQFSLALRPADAERRIHRALQEICEEAVRGREMVIAQPAASSSRAAKKARSRSVADGRAKRQQ